MCVVVEDEIFLDEFVDDEILMGDGGLIGGLIIEGVENFGAKLGSEVGEDTSLLKGLLEDVLHFFDSGHWRKWR